MNAFENIKKLVEINKSFVLEAGAGAGKTYTLTQTLNFLIEKLGDVLEYRHQRIICITYTNVAKNEIIERIFNNPLISVSTIHEFLWESIRSYQKQLKEQLIILNEQLYKEEQEKYKALNPKEQVGFKFRFRKDLSERIDNIEAVYYDDSNFRNFEEGKLQHDDIISISKLMFENYPLLTTVIIDKYPYILVDEYQDTATETIQTLIDIILTNNEKSILLGFFGDSHQKIYEGGIGSLKAYVDKNVLIEIKKEENFRSSSVIVSLLNHIRTNIQQQSQTKILNSTIKFFFYTNPPKEVRKDEKGKNKTEGVREYNKRIQPLKDNIYNTLLNKLIQDGWDLKEGGVDKILILTNSRVAGRAGFGELYKVFSERYGTNAKQRLLDRTHPIIQFFVGSFDKKSSMERLTGVEHLCQFWKYKDYANVISFIKKYGKSDLVYLHSHGDKEKISNCLDSLIQEAQTKSIKEVMEFILKEGLLKRSDRVSEILGMLSIDLSSLEDGEEKEKLIRNKKFLEDFLALPYKQIIAFFQHIQNHTVFSTKHGTKGEEYRNVLVILDDTEWISEYSFNYFFDKSDKESHPKRYQMTKNLFYVSCSRAKEKLVVLMLSPLNEVSQNVIKDWFGESNTIDIERILNE